MVDQQDTAAAKEDHPNHGAETIGRTRPANNATYLAAANLLAKVLSLVFVLYATRALKPALYGNYTATYNFIGVFSLLTDLGLSTLAARNVAQDRSLAVRYISNVLVLRLLFSAVAIVASAALAQIIIAPALRNAVYVAALSLALIAASDTLGLAFRFSERMAYTAVFSVAGTAAAAGLRFLALLLGYHVLALVSIQTVVALATTLVMAVVVYTRFLPRRMELDVTWWPSLLRSAIPFAMMTFLYIMYSQIDKQILYVLSNCGHARGNTGCVPVGRYNAAYLLLDVLTSVFVLGVQTATFTSFSRIAAESIEALTRVVRSSVTLTLVFGLPVALFGAFYAPEALHVLGGKNYLVAAPALSVLMWAFPCFLVLTILYNALWAVHRQTIVTMAFAVTLIFNAGLNILLIPHYSYMACSFLTVASEVLNGVMIVAAVRRHLGSLDLGRVLAKVALVFIVTTAVLWLVHGYGIFVGIPVGTVVFILGLRLTHVFEATEREVLGRLPVIGRWHTTLLL